MLDDSTENDSSLLPNSILSVCGGHLVVDLNRRCVFIDGDPVFLTKLEFDLLYYLADRAGRIVNISELMLNVWNYQSDLHISSAPVKNCISELKSPKLNALSQ